MLKVKTSSLAIKDTNPFGSIQKGYIGAFKLYLLLYLIVSPILKCIISEPVVEFTYARLFLDIIYNLLLFLPIIFYRKEYGWLHPLIFPLLLKLSKDLISQPGFLLSIFDFSPQYSEIFNEALINYRQWEIAMADVDGILLEILALVMYYLGFFYGPKIKTKKYALVNTRNIQLKILIIVFLSLALLFIYISSRGGLTEHFNSWSQGRYKSLAGDGFIFVVIRFGFIAALIWYVLDKNAFKKPFFWISLLFTIPSTFVTQGSRSAIAFSIILLIMGWLLRTRKTPSIRILIFGYPILLLIGLLGEFRRSTFSGSVNWNIIEQATISDAENYFSNEIDDKKKSASGFLPIVAKVPHEVDLLYGKTYLSVLTFYIPRALWKDKPRGAGAYTGRLIFNKTSAGIPPGPVAEAFWNFHIPGVIVVFFLFGVMHNWLARLLLANPDNKAIHVIFILTLFYFTPTAIKMVSYLQQILPAIAILFWVNALTIKNKKKNVLKPFLSRGS